MSHRYRAKHELKQTIRFHRILADLESLGVFDENDLLYMTFMTEEEIRRCLAGLIATFVQNGGSETKVAEILGMTP